MIRKPLLNLLRFYQRFLTLLGFGCCRYYPSCSEYAKWQFEHNSLPSAFYHAFIRILRCNQLFPGGIDYPLLERFKQKPTDMPLDSIKYWLVPKQKNRFFIIKNFDFKG